MSTFHQIARSIDGSEEVRKKIALLQNLYDSAVRDFSREHLNLNRLKMEHVEIIKNSQISAAKITRMKTDMEKLQLHIEFLKKELGFKQQLLNDVESRLKSVENSVDETAIRDMKAMNANLRRAIDHLNMNVRQRSDEISRLNGLLDANRSEIISLKTQLESSKSDGSKVSRSELEALKKKCDIVSAESQKCHSELTAALERKRDEFVAMHASVQVNMDLVSKLEQKFRQMKAEMGDENERLKFEVEHLRRGKERLQKLVEESTGETGQMKNRSTFPMFKKVEGLRGKELTRATLFARSNRVDETSHEVDKSDGNLTETELYSCHSSDEFDGLDIENEEAESKIDWFVV